MITRNNQINQLYSFNQSDSVCFNSNNFLTILKLKDSFSNNILLNKITNVESMVVF